MLSPLLTSCASMDGPALKAAEKAADIALVQRMAAGDSEQALTDFYERFSPMVMGLLMRMMRDPQQSEELLQEVFIELWKRSSQYDPRRSAVTSWVCMVTRSRAIDRMRSQKRRMRDKHVSDDGVSLVGGSEHQPDQLAAAKRRASAVRAALAKLSTDQRDVLELAYFRGMSHSEIASETNLPLGTVKSRILSGMRVLRAELQNLKGGHR